jgi:hypothetical protein
MNLHHEETMVIAYIIKLFLHKMYATNVLKAIWG